MFGKASRGDITKTVRAVMSGELVLVCGFFLAMAAAGRGSFLGGLLGDAQTFLGGRPPPCGFLRFTCSHPRFGAFPGTFLAVRLRMNTKLVPVGLGKIQPVVARSLLDVRERQRAVLLWHIDHLIKPDHGVAHMLGVGQWFFALPRKGKDAVREIASLGKATVPLERLPRGLYRFHLTFLHVGLRAPLLPIIALSLTGGLCRREHHARAQTGGGDNRRDKDDAAERTPPAHRGDEPPATPER